jgi:hypothetical protein
MPIDAVFTLVLGTLIIAAAALGLMRVIGHLAATAKTLGTLDGGVKVIVDQTSSIKVWHRYATLQNRFRRKHGFRRT